MWKFASSRTIPGSSAASSTPSSNRSPSSHTRFLQPSSPRRSSRDNIVCGLCCTRPNRRPQRNSSICMPASDLFLIAGPCVIESEEHVHFLAREIRRIVGPNFIFKASFDKANRSSVSSYRGPGLDEGLRILAGLRKEGYRVLTDIHETCQAEQAAKAVDIIQIPAFLCRQTDLLVAAGRTGKTVNIKKGQFVAPADMRHALEKV